MSDVILDPSDPSIAFIGPVTTVRNVHPAAVCAGRACVVHRPSQHHMRAWPLNWRDDISIMERVCSHKIGHPDPDDLAHHLEHGRAWLAVHGCDGCCVTPMRD